jgi:thermitase
MVNQIYLTEGKIKVMVTDKFVVQFKPSVSLSDIDALNASHKVEINRTSSASPNLYVMKLMPNADTSVMQRANLYYEDPRVVYSLPDFQMAMQKFSTPNDLFYQNQYYLHNTGQTGGIAGADINVQPAWDITTGSPSIKVAVIDDGGGAHPDLPSERIAAGYDHVAFDSDPSPEGNEAQGLAIAGVIAATQNNQIGISGIAPKCKIMFFRVFDQYGSPIDNSYFAEAIDSAWRSGCDVINNSWGGGYDDNITAAINRAMTQGRSNKGTVVVCAGGNYSDRSNNFLVPIAYPASLLGVISVGAVDKSIMYKITVLAVPLSILFQ